VFLKVLKVLNGKSRFRVPAVCAAIWLMVLPTSAAAASDSFIGSENLVLLTTEAKVVIAFCEPVGSDFFTFFQQHGNRTMISGITASLWITRGGESVKLENDLFSSATYPSDQFDQEIANFQSIQNVLPDNLLRLNVGNGVDWFDDSLWDAVISKAVVLSDFVERGGMRGYCLDTEQYNQVNPSFNYAKQIYAGTKNFAEYQAKVRQRGQQLMTALTTSKADVTVMYTFAHSTVARTATLETLDQAAMGLLPAFIDGMMESGTSAEFVDGFEGAYGFKKQEQFTETARYIREQGKKVSLVPEIYADKMKAGFGLWVKGYEGSGTDPWYFSASELEYSMHYALLEADAMIWLYMGGITGWWQNLPPAYANATGNSKYPETFLRDNFDGEVGEVVSAQVSFDVRYAETSLPDKSFMISGIDHTWNEGSLDGESPPDGATDLTYDGTNSWSYLAPISGDYGSSDVNTVAVDPNGAPVGQVSFDVTDLVNEWIVGRENYGLVLRKQAGADGSIGVFTRDSNYPPVLTIEYRRPVTEQVILQGTDVTKDTYVCDFSAGPTRDTNFNGEAKMAVGTAGGTYYRHSRSFIQFDINSVQVIHGANTRVDSAKLKLLLQYESAHDSRNPYGSATYGVYRMLADWDEDEVTFNERLDGVPWVGQQSCPWVGGPWNTGDEIALMPTDEIVVGWGNNRWETQWHEWDVTADLNAWLSGEAENFGWFIRANPWDHAANGEDPFDWQDVNSAWCGSLVFTEESGGTARPQLVLEITEISEPNCEYYTAAPVKDTRLSGGDGTGLNYGRAISAEAGISGGIETDRVIAEWLLPSVVKRVPDTGMWKSTPGIRLDGMGHAVFTVPDAQTLSALTRLRSLPRLNSPICRVTFQLTETDTEEPNMILGLSNIGTVPDSDVKGIALRTDFGDNWVVQIGDLNGPVYGFSSLSVPGSDHSGKWRIDWRLDWQNQFFYQIQVYYNDVLEFDSTTGLPEGGTDTTQWHIPEVSLRPALVMYGDGGTDAVDWVQWEWEGIPGDFDGDGDVDLADLKLLLEHWLDFSCQSENNWCDGADLNQTIPVNLQDFAIFAEHWLE